MKIGDIYLPALEIKEQKRRRWADQFFLVFPKNSSVSMDPIVEETIAETINSVQSEYANQKKLSDRTLSMLSFLFDFTATQALDLIDHKCVLHITSPSGRELYKVQKSSTEFHICLKNSNYCTCPSFVFHVLKKEQLMCKHKLAVMLSTAMGLCNEVQYEDETVTMMLMGENSYQ